MNTKKYILLVIFLIIEFNLNAQIVKGKITTDNKAGPFAGVVLEGTNFGVSADEFGNYEIKNVDLGGVNIIVTGVGIETKKVYVVVTKEINIFDINVEFSTYDIDKIAFK